MIIFKKKCGVSDFLSQLLNYIGKLILNFNRKNLNKYKFQDQIIGFTDELITDTINFEGFLTRIYKKICQLLFNNMSFTVSLQNKIKPDYYPFIIAIPNKYNI